MNKKFSTEKDKKLPTKKNIITLLCKYIRDQTREVTSKNGKSSKRYHILPCPNNEKCTNMNGEIYFQKSIGYTNPCNHLKMCIDELHAIYTNNINRQQSEINNCFPIVNITSREKEMIDYCRGESTCSDCEEADF